MRQALRGGKRDSGGFGKKSPFPDRIFN